MNTIILSVDVVCLKNSCTGGVLTDNESRAGSLSPTTFDAHCSFDKETEYRYFLSISLLKWYQLWFHAVTGLMRHLEY